MKLLHLALVISLLPVMAGAQSFRRGSLVGEIGAGTELLRTRRVYDTPAMRTGDTSSRGESGSAHFSIALEAGLSKRWGIGLRGKLDQFFREVDEVTRTRTYAGSRQVGVLVNWHPVVRDYFDLVIGADAGYARITFHDRDRPSLDAYGNGAFADFYINPRFYVKRWGFNIKGYLPVRYFGNVVNSGESAGNYLMSTWLGTGAGISFGVQLRLL